MVDLKQFYKECRRVLRVTKKPNKKEFIGIVRISGLGLLVIGLIGFMFYLISYFIRG